MPAPWRIGSNAKGRLSWEQTIDCARHICKGLEYAHTAGIIHRDLKPANLFLSRKGYLKIGDFGIARDTQATALTAAGSTVGTYAYMAPEQITGISPVTRKTDLYALGCVLYELLTGRTPFRAETMVEMLQQHLKSEPDRITTEAIDCPVWLESVVMKLLEKDPEKRYYDALAVQHGFGGCDRESHQAAEHRQANPGRGRPVHCDQSRPNSRRL
jgi:eukaryotic-like serine/threonine-protein kinase